MQLFGKKNNKPYKHRPQHRRGFNLFSSAKRHSTRPKLKPQTPSILHRIPIKGIMLVLAVSIAVLISVSLLKNLNTNQVFEPKSARWQVSGILPNASLLSIKRQAKPLLATQFSDIDLHQLKQQIQTNPWVKSAQIERTFWGRLRIKLRIKTPVLRLNNTGYIDELGYAFTPKHLLDTTLPLAITNPDNSQTTLKQYKQYSKILTTRFSIKVINSNVLTQLIIDNNTTLKLGYNQHIERLQEFKKIYTRLLRKYKSIDHLIIDLQYKKGGVVISKP